MSGEMGPSEADINFHVPADSPKKKQNPTPEEIRQNAKTRTLHDAELLQGGAEYEGDSEADLRLIVTEQQKKDAREEMEGFEPGERDSNRRMAANAKEGFESAVSNKQPASRIRSIGRAWVQFLEEAGDREEAEKAKQRVETAYQEAVKWK